MPGATGAVSGGSQCRRVFSPHEAPFGMVKFIRRASCLMEAGT
jgi:hypothetical protein